jgi:hypothetical protein
MSIRTIVRRLAAGLAAAAAAGALAPGKPAVAGTITFTLDAATLQSFLRAVTPHDVVVGKGGLSETLTLSNPRDVRFEDGRVRLRLDCRGAPLPIEEVLEPALSLRYSDVKKGFEARVESLPLKIPVLGTIDLAEYLRPITIPSVFSRPAGEGDETVTIDGRIVSLRVLETMIQASADVTFRRAALPAKAPAPPPKAASPAPLAPADPAAAPSGR